MRMTDDGFDMACPGKRGWYCVRFRGHLGPCALWPHWYAHPVTWFKMGKWRSL